MRIEPSLDTGPVYACERVAIGPEETAGELRHRLSEVATRLLVEQLPAVPSTTPVPQHGEPTYAEKLTIDEFRVDPQRTASELERLVRAGNPRPGAWMTVGGQRMKVLRARATDAGGEPGEVDRAGVLGTAGGGLVLVEVQPAGKRPMPGGAWRRGLHGAVRVDRA
jgi:methionyl-tRNA formyltransferase